MYQKVLMVGNLGRDPEMRYTDSGKAMCNFSIAVNFFVTGGEKKTMWVRVLTFDKTAEQVNAYLKKGRACLVEGRLTADPETGGPKVYLKKDGTPAASFEMIATSVTFLGKESDSPQASDVKPASGKAEVVYEEDDFPL